MRDRAESLYVLVVVVSAIMLGTIILTAVQGYFTRP